MAQLGNIKASDDVAQTNEVLPAGVMLPFAGNAAPEGWLLCEGQEVSRATYAALFAAIGTTYGAGNGTTTFNVPDLRGRTPVGADNMGGGRGAAGRVTANNKRGEGSGEQTHALTEGELAVHKHGVTDPGHAHGVTDPGHNHSPTQSDGVSFASISYIGGGAGGQTGSLGGSGYNNGFIGISTNKTNVTVNAAATGISTNNSGAGTAHNNMQPYQVHQFIVKT